MTASPDPSEARYRTRVPDLGDERTLVEAMLDFHRGTLRWKCDGLSPEQLNRAAIPTTSLTLVGLVRHMAVNERWWFRVRAAGLEPGELYNTDENPTADLDGGDVGGASADLDLFDAEVMAARAATSRLPLDHEFLFPDKDGAPMSLRFVYLHMIEEYARHNGHADLLREAIDGATGE